MNKQNRLSILIFLLLAIALCLPTLPASAQRSSRDMTLESVGKENPFEVVRPIVEAKKKLISKMLKPGEYISAQQQIVEILPDMYMQTVMLKFLRAESLEPVASNLLSAYGKISIDSATNSIIICDTDDKVQMIIAEIRKVDKTPQQVMIEVVIVDVQLQDNTEIGVNWGDFNFGRDDTKHTFSQNLISSTLSSGSALVGTFGFVQNGLDITIKALQATRDVEILASPRLLVVSGQEAMIKTVEEIPYVELSESTSGTSGSGYGITSTKFKEAGITLTVKATLTDEQKILLAVDAQQSINAGIDTSLGTNVPIVDKRNAKTNLLMNDGQVLIMGGLRKKETTLTINKVPLLGDLPLVGFLFSSDKTEVAHSELLIMISPHIYRDEPLTDEEMQRFNELRNVPLLQLPRKNRPEYEAIDAVMPSFREE